MGVLLPILLLINTFVFPQWILGIEPFRLDIYRDAALLTYRISSPQSGEGVLRIPLNERVGEVYVSANEGCSLRSVSTGELVDEERERRLTELRAELRSLEEERELMRRLSGNIVPADAGALVQLLDTLRERWRALELRLAEVEKEMDRLSAEEGRRTLLEVAFSCEEGRALELLVSHPTQLFAESFYEVRANVPEGRLTLRTLLRVRQEKGDLVGITVGYHTYRREGRISPPADGREASVRLSYELEGVDLLRGRESVLLLREEELPAEFGVRIEWGVPYLYARFRSGGYYPPRGALIYVGRSFVGGSEFTAREGEELTLFLGEDRRTIVERVPLGSPSLWRYRIRNLRNVPVDYTLVESVPDSGAEPVPEGARLSPEGKVVYRFTLEGGEERELTIGYGEGANPCRPAPQDRAGSCP